MADFRAWIASKDEYYPSLTIQIEQSNNDYRFLVNHLGDFEETYLAMWQYEIWLY